jgi:hypothetical protein
VTTTGFKTTSVFRAAHTTSHQTGGLDILGPTGANKATYFKQWKIKINGSKTQALYFIRCWAPRKLPFANIGIGGHPIPWFTEAKYLGVTLDKTLLPVTSIEKSEKAFCIFRNRKSRLNKHNKLLFYRTTETNGTCIRSILCYGVETWFFCANTYKKRLQIIQNKYLKIIMNCHWRYSTSTLHEEANVRLPNVLYWLI